jgi:hypothetical protein
LPNLERPRDASLEVHLTEQRERRLLLEYLLEHDYEGRSMSFCCTACTLLPPELVRQTQREMEQSLAVGEIGPSDLKLVAKTMRSLLTELARQAGVELRLRK